jgi:hypothetical protein
MTTTPLWPNRKKTVKQEKQGPTQPVASTRPSSACLRRNLHDGVTCTTRRRASARLGNPSQTCFDVMPHLPPAHHETSNRDSPNETKVNEKQNKTIPNSNSNLAKSMTHHNQTKKRTTWFLNLPLDELIDNKSIKFEVRIQNPMKHS